MKVIGVNIYNTQIPSNMEIVTTSTMQRHIVQGPNGILGAIIQRGNDVGLPPSERGLVFIRSLDHGKTWILDYQLIDRYLYTAAMYLDEHSMIHVLYTKISPGSDLGIGDNVYYRMFVFDTLLKKWLMGSESLVYQNVAPNTDTWGNIAREPGGRLWACWRHYQQDIDRTRLRIVYSDDLGLTWTYATGIGFDNNKSERFGFFVITSQFIMICLHDTDNDGTEYKRSAKHNYVDPPSTWTVETIISVISAAAGTHFNAVADADETIHMTIEEDTLPETIKVVRYHNGAWESPEIAGFGESAYPTVCIDREANLIYGFANTDNNRRIAHRTYDPKTLSWGELQHFDLETELSAIKLNAGDVISDVTDQALSKWELDTYHPNTNVLIRDVGDYIGLWHMNKNGYISWEMGQPGVGGVVEWRYWNGTSYTPLTIDEIENGSFEDNYGYMEFTPPSDWAPQSGYYAIRAVVMTAYTQGPIGDRITARRFRRRLAIPAEIKFYLSGHTLPSIIREGDARFTEHTQWITEVECIVWDVSGNRGGTPIKGQSDGGPTVNIYVRGNLIIR